MAETSKHSQEENEKSTPRSPEPAMSAADAQAEAGQAETQESSRLQAAAEALERARAELHHAQEYYDQLRQQAAERLQQVRETTVGDLFDSLRSVVRKFPGPSLLVALVVGFLLGRKSRW